MLKNGIKPGLGRWRRSNLHNVERGMLTFGLALVGMLLVVKVAIAAPAAPPLACVEALSVESPCVGILVPPEEAVQALQCLRVDLPTTKADLDRSEAMRQAENKTAESVLRITEKYADKQSALLEAGLYKPLQKSFWEEPGLWFVVGTVVGVAATIGVVYAVK